MFQFIDLFLNDAFVFVSTTLFTIFFTIIGIAIWKEVVRN